MILVVEDDAITRQALLDSLKLLTYRTVPAANGAEALAILEEFGNQISLVLTDVVMPVMGGLALFEEIRRRGMAVPVIMLTGHPMHQQLNRLKERGLRAWMQKPVSIQQLAREISLALEP
jgi:CheY-like chemotaxis protein